MGTSYSIEELTFKEGLQEADERQKELDRNRTIFVDLMDKSKKGISLLEREKVFLCSWINVSNIKEDGNLEDHDVCEGFIFQNLYLVYYSHLEETNVFHKVHQGSLYVVSEEEKNKDLKLLQEIKEDWLLTIKITNHSGQTLQRLSKETRDELKALDKKYRGKLVIKSSRIRYKRQREKLILHSKYIYLKVKQILEDASEEDRTFEYLGESVICDSDSLIHIIQRHYAKVIKDNPDKSYLTEDFMPSEFFLSLKPIFNKIEKSGLIPSDEIEKTSFDYKSIKYQVWIKKRKKHIKGRQEEFYRLETFYPVEGEKELKDLNDNYKLHEIDSELSVYIKK